MANEITVNSPVEQSVMSIVTQTAKTDSTDSNETGFSQILNECDTKIENGIGEKIEDTVTDAAVFMAGYVPIVSYADVDEPIENIDVAEISVQVDDVDTDIDIDVSVQNEIPQVTENTENTQFLNIELADDTENAVVNTFDTVIAAENTVDTVYEGYAAGEVSKETDFAVKADTEETEVETFTSDNVVEDNSAERFIGFINTNGFKANEIESVKYQTVSQTIGMSGNTKTFDDMESLIQKIFADNSEQNVENSVIEDVQLSSDIDFETDVTAVTEMVDTVVTVEKNILAEENIKTEKNIETEESVDVQTNAENETVTITEVTDNKTNTENDKDSNFGKNDDAKTGFEKVPVKNVTAEKTKNTFGITHTENFKIYDIDTSANTTQQVHRVMANTFTTSGFLENVQSNKEMVIQLNPETLGKIVIKLQSVDGSLDIQIKATNAEVRNMLSSQMAHLGQTIKEQGVNLNSVQIEQSALRNDKEQGGNAYKDEREKKQKNDKDDETDYKSIMDDIEASFAEIVGIGKEVKNVFNY